jgi:hypothetical protein
MTWLLWLLPLIAWLLPWLFIAPRVGVLLAGEMDLPDDPTKSTSLPGELAESRTMPALTRRRDVESRQEYWLIYYGDVHVGTIAVRSGIPHDQPQWGWRCGFYPGSHPREHQSGTAATFDQARADFEAAWRVFLSKRTEVDFQEWRDNRDLTAEKYRRFDPRRAHAARLAGLVPDRGWKRTFDEPIALPRRLSRPPGACSYPSGLTSVASMPDTINTHTAQPMCQKRASIMSPSSSAASG